MTNSEHNHKAIQPLVLAGVVGAALLLGLVIGVPLLSTTGSHNDHMQDKDKVSSKTPPNLPQDPSWGTGTRSAKGQRRW
jgi:hypothetical protein